MEKHAPQRPQGASAPGAYRVRLRALSALHLDPSAGAGGRLRPRVPKHLATNEAGGGGARQSSLSGQETTVQRGGRDPRQEAVLPVRMRWGSSLGVGIKMNR